MSKVLEDKKNSLVTSKPANNEKDLVKNQKSNDFIFKRYTYEQNTIINGVKSKGKATQQNGSDDYDQMDKENKLQKYKLQLEKQGNHFEIVDFGEEDHENQHEEKTQNYQSQNHQDAEFMNPFQFDQDNQTERDQQRKQQKIQTESSVYEQNVTPSKVKEFDLKPMELIDFENQDEYEDQDQDQDEDEITQVNPPQENIFTPSKLNSSNSHQATLSPSKSQVSSTFMSPDQSIDGGFGLEESVCNFVRKAKQLEKESTFQQQQKPFSPESRQIQKYQVHRFSQKDNPFEDAVDYSNDQQLKGIKIYQSPYEDIKVQIFDKNLFVSSKIPPGIILKCKLKRSKGFFSLMNPEFDLYLENGLKHLISARKNLFRNRQLFQLSTEMSNFSQPIRTLMANVLHNTYWLVDAPRVIDRKKISYLDLLIEYKPLNEEVKKQREMTILCPPALKTYHIGLQYDIPYIDFQWFKKNISLKLYFRGRKSSSKVRKNSQKNFDLVDSEEQQQEEEQTVIKEEQQKQSEQNRPTEYTGQTLFNDNNKGKSEILELKQAYLYLKMEKESENVFDVEIQHPLTPLQAMAIILTRFDAQLK